jgi:ribosomal protein S18 acetylase RimI-like enzyme
MKPVFHVYPLDTSVHDREGFDCGVSALNEYLAKRARKDVASGVAACFVATEEGGPRILGYYTLSAATIVRASLPEKLLKKLPRYPELPATLLGRLAVSIDFRGQGLGTRLLLSAMRRSADAAADVASIALVTDPKDEAAGSFYRRFGFEPLTPQRMFLPMQAVAELLNAR